MNENIQRYFSILMQSLYARIQGNGEEEESLLDYLDKIWNNFELDTEVRRDLLRIGQDFFEGTDIKTDVIDIVLCGSLCNYNWSERYSDYDLHIIVNQKDIDDDSEVAEKLCDFAKNEGPS